MKRVLILALIALTCTFAQAIEDFVWDSTQNHVALTAEEVSILDSARLAYYALIQEEHNFDWPEVYATLMEYWLHDTYDSLQACGKSWESYDCYLWRLWVFARSESKRLDNKTVVEHYSDFEISIGGRHRFIWRELGRHWNYYPLSKD